MKMSTVVALSLLFCATQALAFQERPLSASESMVQLKSGQGSAISQFSDDDNDGAIAQAYGQGQCASSTASADCGRPFYTRESADGHK